MYSTCLNGHIYAIIFYIVTLQESLFSFCINFYDWIVIDFFIYFFFIQMIEALRRDGTDFLDIRIVRHKSGKRESFIGTSNLLFELLSFQIKFGNTLVIRGAQSKSSLGFSVEVLNTEQQVKA